MDHFLNNFFILLLAVGSAMASPSQLASAEVSATCQLKDISNKKIADLCASIGNPARNLEYFHCTPKAESKDSVAHYIYQETYSDKENLSDVKLAGLFKGMGPSTKTARDLTDIVQIDEKVDALSSLDIKFASHPNSLVFDLVIISNDGELQEGKITNTVTREVTEVTCLDISLEK